MKRRDFSLAIASLGTLSLASQAHAQARAFKVDSDFTALKKRAPVEAPAGKVEIVEFFSYNCPHCAEFEPRLEAWVKTLPSYVYFRRAPVPFVGPNAKDIEAKQRLYYALEAMGKADEFQPQIFQAIHQRREPIFGEEAILAWAQKQPGLDGKKFAELFKSYPVAAKAKQASALQEAYHIEGVPTLGVAGRWLVDSEKARGMDRMLEVAAYLASEARKG